MTSFFEGNPFLRREDVKTDHNPPRSLTLLLILQKCHKRKSGEKKMTKRVLYLFPFATKSKLSLLLHLVNYLISSGPATVL